jgi:dienelactone hydrolase
MSADPEVRIPVDGAVLDATVEGPADPRGVILFAHGSGSSRHSPRNRMVAERLHRSGYVTVLLDLLTPAEAAADERTAQLRFDIEMLASRLIGVIDWLVPRGEPLGLFGASTGAAAALIAAAERPKQVGAVVSRGGRPDLAGGALKRVSVPTLLVVGGNDEIVVALNETAADVLADHAEVVIIPGATHLFAEPGALERVAELAADWFDRQMG